ncbi:OLC1v1031795C4 [Oldenlandia corymbosa var. corymbosa]|uniref:OLC1v1031795C4 n=1 Tax=Oldenlandia corymbosa var. corymbosa TaxID=529605 RepID=A0AAV1CJ81_OLDCO|nr:OLC1v1031795C4 [Oldenlandia corymbosa var. corymbosa]
MSGLIVGGGVEKTVFIDRQNGDSGAHPLALAQHRRSKSASDKNFTVPQQSQSHPEHNGVNQPPQELLPITGSCRASTLHGCSMDEHKDSVSRHRASLEKDIEQLQLRLQQERTMRMVLERAMGRASSTLSPGHHHFAAQTKELLTEIELLEEEVANREQHVLSLYRSIFEQCISRSSSEQSSVMTSPAHAKNEPRKHPSIISSAFCSSKKFPLRTLHALASINDSGKRDLLQYKTRHASLFTGKANIHFEKPCTENTKVQEHSQTMRRPSVLRTLKDHLNQCPSKLSEEMVRCMAAVYCWLRSTASTNIEQNRSPLLSRSSTSVILPRRGIAEEKDWPGKCTVEISNITTDKSNFSHASYAINNYRILVEQLERVNANQMEADAQIAFWINIYNALIMHAYLAYGIPHSSLRRLALFHKAAYNICGMAVNADAIEQSILHFRAARIGKWLETLVSTALRKKSSEERHLISSRFGHRDAEPLVCFALCTGAFSDPTLRVYTASNIKEELESAKREFLQANIVVKKSKKVFLPKVLERYMKEARIPADELLKWIAENVDKKLHESIKKCIDRTSNRKLSQIIEWLPYNPRFRYVFAKELTEKPWWV